MGTLLFIIIIIVGFYLFRRFAAQRSAPPKFGQGYSNDQPTQVRPVISPPTPPPAAFGDAQVDVVNIADPQRNLSSFADRLRAAGYSVEWQADPRQPMFSGWQVTGHRDGRRLDEQEIMRHFHD